jgi:molecular chaperone Hsp33
MSDLEPRPIDARATARPDELVRTISRSGSVAVKTIVASQLVAEALSRRAFAPTAAHALGRSMMGALLIAVGSAADDADEANVESVQLQLRGDGPLGSVTAIADSRARVRGTVAHPEVDLVHGDGTPNLSAAVGFGPLNVVRHRPRWRTPYTGTVPIVSGEVARDLTLYLTESEQTPSAMGLAVAFGPRMRDVAACGFLVQSLPDAHDEDLAQVEDNVAALSDLARHLESPIDASGLADHLLLGLGGREYHTMRPAFHCPCSHERARRTLALLEERELAELVSSRQSQEIVCDFCGGTYRIEPVEIAALLESTREARA